jgi:hypothetical protein
VFSLQGMRESLGFLLGHRRKMKLVLICGPWGSGTTAVAGMMAKLGARGFGPYVYPGDPQTPNSFEFVAFRESILRLASEDSVGLIPGALKTARTELRRLHRRIEDQKFGSHDPNGSIPIFFKYPLSALLIPKICNVFDTRLIYVIRSLEDIERTRVRRKWSPHFGSDGAKIIYRAMNDFEQMHSHPIFTLRYVDLISEPARYALELARFSGLEPNPAQFRRAVGFVRLQKKSESGSSQSTEPG